jgi:hypothetical protein
MIHVPGALVSAGQPGAGSRIVFAGNIIPENRINPVGRSAIGYYPLPNQAGLINSYLINSAASSSDNQFIARVDYNLSSTRQIYGRIIQERNLSTNEGPYPGNIASTQANMHSQTRPGTIGLDYVDTVTPRMVLHLNGGWTRQSIVSTTISDGFDPTSLGFPAAVANASGDSRVFPSFAPVGYGSLGPPRNFGSTKNNQDAFSFNQDVSLLGGVHSLKFGANQRVYRIYNHRPDDPAGNFGFTRAFTARTATDIVSGDPIASLLLGNPASGRLGIAQWFNVAAFAQPAQYALGNAPRVLPSVRGPGYFSTNLSLQRDFRFTETIRFQFRAEGYNIFNRANFTTPVAILGANNFGRILNTEAPRQFQFGAKLYF